MSLLFYNLLGMKPKGFGLEIEDSSLKAIALKKGRRCKEVVSCGIRPLKKGIVTEGQIVDQQAMANEIKILLASTKPKPIQSEFVVFSVPESKSFIRTIQIPKMSRGEAEEAVKWETEANIPVSADKVYLDWQIIDSQEKKDEILVVAVPKEIIDSYCESIKLAKLSPLAAEVDIIATIRSLTSAQEEKTVLIVDIGADITSLAICKNQVPYFTSSLPISGKTFTDVLQKGLGVSREKAEDLKEKYGLGEMQKDDMLYNIYSPLIENLAQEIEKSLVFYTESINAKNEVSEIILSGGGSLLRQMVDYLATRIGKNVVLGNPAMGLGNFKDLPADVIRNICPFASAVGLAIKAYNYEN
ncbi:MAG: type IV pilus assembly protein PilM [Patescibacteria group bacterium]|nr:type IV pilus assembly protein PilM [Patescibacteria group bacterium]